MAEATVPVDRSRNGDRTYADTVSRGFYGRYVGGLSGKWDNVRTYWEDQVIRTVLRPYVSARVAACRRQRRGVRIADLGCGTGQGYELLTSIPRQGLCLEDSLQHVLSERDIAAYLGLDLSAAMIGQGRENYSHAPHVRFEQADLRDGLGPAGEGPPFDIYFSSYGSLSHLDPPALHGCLSEIVEHAWPGALVVLDLVGRLSPEWPGYWHTHSEADRIREYSMSYLYPKEERITGNVERFPLCFWTGPEIAEFCGRIRSPRGRVLKVLRVVDRSIFVGRHVDTGEYGSALPPLRGLVNGLFEADVRTSLDRLRVHYEPVTHAPSGLNEFFSQLAACWTHLVDFTIERLTGRRVDLVSLDGWSDFLPPLQLTLMNMDRVIDSVAWLRTSDVRANVVEPQLASLLRDLEMALQRGLGCGHGLLVVAETGQDDA